MFFGVLNSTLVPIVREKEVLKANNHSVKRKPFYLNLISLCEFRCEVVGKWY